MQSSTAIGIFAAATAAVGLAYTLFSDRTKSERESWQRAKDEFIYTAEQVDDRILAAKQAVEESQCEGNYRLFRELRRESIAVSNNMYEKYASIRNLIADTHAEIKKCSERIHALGTELDRHDLDMSTRKQKYAEYKEQLAYKKFLYDDLTKNKNDYHTFRQIVDCWNNRTHTLNEFIRDRCGYDGQRWYENYMARKQVCY